MTTIELVANDQLLQVTVSPKISSGEVNTVSIHVDFSDEWNNFEKNAVFFTSYNSHDIYEIVMTNDECIVPYEVMTKSCILYIGIRGINSEENKVKTTSLVKLNISEGTPTGNVTEVEPTPDVYQQLLTAYGNMSDKSDVLSARLDSVSATRIANPEQFVFNEFILPDYAQSISGEITFKSNGIYARMSGTVNCVFTKRGESTDTWITYGNYVKILTLPDYLSFLDCGDANNMASDVRPNDYKGWAIKGNELYIDAPKYVSEDTYNKSYIFDMDDYAPLTYPYSNSDLAFEVADARVDNNGTVYDSLGAFIRHISQLESGIIAEIEDARVDNEGNTYDSLGNIIRQAFLSGGGNIESEVIDIRVKADGSTATSAGNAVREQITELKSDLVNSKKAIAELNDKKITKFYASNLGETNLSDSDNGKIQDMILYGKSEQGSTTGKNLLNATLATTTTNGVTCTNNGDGTYTLNGTASANAQFTTLQDSTNIINSNIGKTLKLVGCPSNGSADKYKLSLYSNNGSVNDYGTGTTINCVNSTVSNVYIIIYSGTVCNNLVFKPMITTDESATYDDFEPYTGGIPSPNPDYPQEIKSVVNPVITLSDGENSQTATLPVTLNAIPVSEGGNVTIDGQQYIADYVDVERKKIVRNVGKTTLHNTDYEGSNSVGTNAYYIRMKIKAKNDNSSICVISDKFIGVSFDKRTSNPNIDELMSQDGKVVLRTKNNTSLDWSTEEKCRQWLADNTPTIVYILETPTEEPLTDEKVQAFKELQSYYPTTNIAVTSDELDGYTTFNYPISMKNGWDYIKQQLGDTRDYIYDMDLQSAEAYINSEYAVALAELEV